MYRNDWLAIALILGAALAAVAMVIFGLSGCANKETAVVQTEYNVTEGAHSAKLGKCLADTKADGGRFEDFCKNCWYQINGEFGLDAGECK